MASKRHLRWRSCEEKVKRTEDDARIRARNRGHRYHAYSCDFCGHWHVGRARSHGGRGKATIRRGQF